MWLTHEPLACASIQMANRVPIERGRPDAYDYCLVLAVGQSWRPRKLHPCARHRMAAQSGMSLHHCPQTPERNSKAINGWPCMSAQKLRRPIGQNNGWGAANCSVRCDSGGRRYGQLDLLINTPIVFIL